MTSKRTLVSVLDVYGSEREHYTLPAGTEVTVHHFSSERWAVASDGYVYRASHDHIDAATRSRSDLTSVTLDGAL